jgi:hypothetical protein
MISEDTVNKRLKEIEAEHGRLFAKRVAMREELAKLDIKLQQLKGAWNALGLLVAKDGHDDIEGSNHGDSVPS